MASIARASSPPDATLASGKRRLARVGAEQELHVRPGEIVADPHLEPGTGQRELVQVRLDAPRQAWAQLPAVRRRDAPPPARRSSTAAIAALLERGPRLLGAGSSSASSCAAGPLELERRRRGSAVLAPQLSEEPEAFPDRFEALRVLRKCFAAQAQLVRDVVEVGLSWRGGGAARSATDS